MTNRLAKRVLLIGWDAADWKVAAPLMDSGKMPHLERLVSEGVMGNLATLYPVLSPMLWTSIATGKRAHKHGVHGFAEPDPRTGAIRPITSLGRKCKALWNILSQNGLKSNVVAWWPSYPAEPINGVMVSNHFQEAHAAYGKEWPIRPGSVSPAQLAPQLGKFRVHPRELSLQQVQPFVPEAGQHQFKDDPRFSGLMKVLAETASVHAVATALMQHEPWDFMAVYYDSIDHFCHGFMRYHPPRLDWVEEKDFNLYKDVINVAYQFHDMMLGALLALAGDDTTVILMSDHGFHSDHLRPRELPNEPAGPADEHRGFGLFAMRGAGVKRDELVHGASLLDVAPTVLSLFGLPVGDDMDGRVLATAFETPPAAASIPSWEEVPGEAGQHPPDLQIDAVDARESLKQLVALGYIEKPDESREKAAAQTVRELQYNLARSYFGARMLPEALRLFDQLWAEFPDEGRFGVKAFECQLGLRKTAEAEATLTELMGRKRRYAEEAAQELKKLQEERKDTKAEDLPAAERKKLLALRRKMAVNPAAVAYLWGSLRHAQGLYEEALEQLEQAEQVELHNRPSLYAKMGDCLIGLKRWAEATSQFRSMLAIDATNPEARVGLARCYLARRQPRRALRQATAAVGLAYAQPVAHFLCGRALRRLGQYDEAVQSLQTALAQNPVFPEAHRHLAAVYRLLEKHDLAARQEELAAAAKKRIAAFRAGRPLPEDADVELDVQMAESVGPCDQDGILAGLPMDGETVVVVSGLPRSGTSMMMQLLAAGGVPVLTDAVREADSDNPRGYYEFEPAKRGGQDNSWVPGAGGKAVKLVAQLLPGLPPGPDYRILFMRRPLQEVVASQKAMLARQNRTGAAISDRRLAAAYRAQIAEVGRVLKGHAERVSVLNIDYHEALANPAGIASQVNRFLGGVLNAEAMAKAIEPTLRRQTSAGSDSRPLAVAGSPG